MSVLIILIVIIIIITTTTTSEHESKRKMPKREADWHGNIRSVNMSHRKKEKCGEKLR
jgi:hypothetical protein